MFPLSLSEARKRYPGGSFRVAAQVNNDIVMRDRLESPGAREVAALQKLGMVSEEKGGFSIALSIGG
ncbi:unnamed protein product, partial [Symbiodinium pilosum]